MYATSLYFSVFEKYFSMFKLLRKTYAKTILENIIQEVLTYKMAKRGTMVILGVKEEA
jgi:hypothetical protein